MVTKITTLWPRQQPYDCKNVSDREIWSRDVLKLTNRFETYHLVRDETPGAAWTAIRQTNNDTADKMLRMKKSPKEEWISVEFWDLIKKKSLLNILSTEPRPWTRACYAWKGHKKRTSAPMSVVVLNRKLRRLKKLLNGETLGHCTASQMK